MELHKKVKGNAVSAYFLILVSISFLISKGPYIDHPFVKSHVKSAFLLHVILLTMLFVMSFDFLDNYKILHYSINTIITAFAGLFIFAGMLYGAWQAHSGKTVTLGEIFHSTGMKKNVLLHSENKQLEEEDTSILILAHVPFLGYLTYGTHKELPHIRDIALTNMLVTILSLFLFIIGSTSLASIIILGYTIWSVSQSIRLVLENKITTLDTSIFPTAEEKYLLQKALVNYIGNMLKKDIFIKFKDLIELKKKALYEQEKNDITLLKQKKESSIPSFIFYIPFVNIIGLFFLKTRDVFHIKNGITITLLISLYIGLSYFLEWNNTLLLFLLFPICYGISYIPRKAYRMPYIYDIYSLFACIVGSIVHIFHRTRELQKTDTQTLTKIGTNSQTKK